MNKGFILALVLLSGSIASSMPCDVSSVWLTCRSKTYTLKAHFCGMQNSLRSVEIKGEGLEDLVTTSEWDGAGFYGLQALSERTGKMILLEMNRQSKKGAFTFYTKADDDMSWTKVATETAQCGYASDEEVAP